MLTPFFDSLHQSLDILSPVYNADSSQSSDPARRKLLNVSDRISTFASQPQNSATATTCIRLQACHDWLSYNYTPESKTDLELFLLDCAIRDLLAGLEANSSQQCQAVQDRLANVLGISHNRLEKISINSIHESQDLALAAFLLRHIFAWDWPCINRISRKDKSLLRSLIRRAPGIWEHVRDLLDPLQVFGSQIWIKYGKGGRNSSISHSLYTSILSKLEHACFKGNGQETADIVEAYGGMEAAASYSHVDVALCLHVSFDEFSRMMIQAFPSDHVLQVPDVRIALFVKKLQVIVNILCV